MNLSVVVPSFNQGSFLEATLKSILMQERKVEVLVYDGGSTDESVSILREYEGRIEYVSQKDAGQADAINQGLQHASGDILTYLNSDDVYWPGALAQVVNYFEVNPDCAALYGDAWHLNEDGSINRAYPTEAWSYPRLLEVCYLCQPAVFWRREVMERFGLFDPTLHYALDYDYWLRVGREIDFHYLPGIFLAGSRLYPEAKTLKRRLEAHHEILKVVMRYVEEPPYQWLRNFASVVVELERQKTPPETFDARTEQAMFVNAVLKIADLHHIELLPDFLTSLELMLPAA